MALRGLEHWVLSSAQHSFKHSCATKQPPGCICRGPSFPLPVKLHLTVRRLSCEGLQHLLSEKFVSVILAFWHMYPLSFFFLAGYTLHLIMTLMNYPQSNLGNFGVPLQRFYDFGRPFIYTFVLQYVLIKQSFWGGRKRYGDLLLFLLNIPHLELQNCKR